VSAAIPPAARATREEPRRDVAVEGHELIAGADDRDAEHSRESA
jgi:hypothetical protein